MPLRILSGKGAVQIMPFRKLGGKCHFLLRFCTRKRSETYISETREFKSYLFFLISKLVTSISSLGVQKFNLIGVFLECEYKYNKDSV